MNHSKSIMNVIKRDGNKQGVDFNKVTSRIRKLSPPDIDPIVVAQKVCISINDGITTEALDNLAADTAIALATAHPDYGVLASNILTSNLHKQTCGSFHKTFTMLHEKGIIADDVFSAYLTHADVICNTINYDLDYSFDYFGTKTLIKGYLLKIDNKTVERPQDLIMRVALGIHKLNIDSVLETYKYMSERWFTHATPTLFNAGTKRPQMSSCFLLGMKSDSIDGIYDTLNQCAQISKWAGGIGLHVHNIRATGSPIRGTNGNSTGIVPMLKVFNSTARYVNQGGKRNGSIAIYLQVDHADVFDFLDLRKNTGDEEYRCRDLFLAAWIPDLFMRRVSENGKWSLFCPDKAPGLSDVYGDEYENLYTTYESKGMYNKQINAQDLWFAICESQIETGTPYILFKDAVNNKSNQKNLGTIKSSNLCCEVTLYTSPEEVAVCNLASISLQKCVKDGHFDFDALELIAGVITKNLNSVIDNNFYPIPEAKVSNMRHRPIGIGVQGLADVFMMLRLPFESIEAKELNIQIFETLYFGALWESTRLAKRDGRYETFDGSPASKGILQFDMWGVTPNERYDWKTLKDHIKTYGLRNSMLVSPMPTASTSQILGNNECFEPYTSNIYLRRTIAGEFVVINKHLVKDLIAEGLWTIDMKNEIISNDGSVQNIRSISPHLKDIYKTVWEMKQKSLIDMSADRAPYICQTQSLNLFLDVPDMKKLSSMHFYSWKKGLKTGIYYLRTKPAANAQKFTIEHKPCDTCSA
jgi:ribonucleoside-diphosphate reductase alpha chain